jgi:hypothetical protein
MRFLTYNELKRFPPYGGKPVSPPHAQPVSVAGSRGSRSTLT